MILTKRAIIYQQKFAACDMNGNSLDPREYIDDIYGTGYGNEQ